MDLAGVPQPQMQWDASNPLEAWTKFKQHVQLIFDGPLAEKEEKQKIRYLFLWAGEKGRDVYNTWTLSESEGKSLEAHYKKFQEYVQPKQNPVFSRYKFNNETQGARPVEQYITRLRLLAKDCVFEGAEDDMIRDRLVFGTNSAKVREKLINKGAQLTLEKAIQIAQNFEYSQQQLKTMGPLITDSSDNASQRDVSAVNRGRPYLRGRGRANMHHHRSTAPSCGRNTQSKRQDERRGRDNSNAHQNKCPNCGFDHQRDARCPARGKQCSKCRKWNHFSKVCKSVSVIRESEYCDVDGYDDMYESFENVDVNDNVTDHYDGFFIDCIAKSCTSVKNSEAFAELNVMHADSCSIVNCKLDTGSQVNVLPLDMFKRMKVQYPLHPAQNLVGYGGSPLKSIGVCSLDIDCKGKRIQTDFHIIDTQGKKAPPILGLPSCLNLKLVKLVDSVNITPPLRSLDRETVLTEYNDVFNGIGLFPGEVKIEVDPSVQPVIHRPRRVPQVISKKLKVELDKMERERSLLRSRNPLNGSILLSLQKNPMDPSEFV